MAGAECGRLEVFEDREAGEGRSIELKVVVLPALGRGPAPDPLFILAGGPGMPASALAGLAEAGMRRVRERREIVLVDQRGTGELSPLRCDDVDADSTYFSFDLDLPLKSLRECLESFEADPRQYITPAAMDDLDDARRALGYERINLWGGSYGTRAALVYLRRHPERVRAVVLDGVAPTGMRLPVQLGEDARRSAELMLADCEADPDCGAAFPEVRRQYEELLARLDEAPGQVRAPHPRTGEILDLELRRQHVLFLLRAALYNGETTRLLPLVIERAHGGDYGPLLALSDPFVEGVSEMSVPLLFSVMCAEDVAWMTDEDHRKVAAEPFLGSAVMDLWGPVCDFWPKGGPSVRVPRPRGLGPAGADPLRPARPGDAPALGGGGRGAPAELPPRGRARRRPRRLDLRVRPQADRRVPGGGGSRRSGRRLRGGSPAADVLPLLHRSAGGSRRGGGRRPMISIEGLTKRFGEVAAVDGVSFEARDGEVTGLLGPNGAGKTTTLRMLSGLMRPDAGRIAVDGVDAAADPSGARGAHGGPARRPRPLPEAHRPRAPALLRAAPGAGRSRSRPAHPGARGAARHGRHLRPPGPGLLPRRAHQGLPRTGLIHDPRTVLMDEPTNGLDVGSTRAVRGLIRRMREEGRCVLFSSHIMQEVAALCDRIVILADGRVAASGTPDELRARSGHDSLEDAFVALSGMDEVEP